MTTITIRRTISALLAFCLVLPGLLLLSGCGGEEKGATTAAWTRSETLIFAYPYPGQEEVTPSAQVVLRFSAPLAETVLEDIDNRLQLVTAEGGNPVGFSYETVDDGRGLLLRPSAKLAANTEYRVQLIGEGLGSIDTGPFNDFRFRTAGAQQGFAEAIGDGDFRLRSVTPLDQTALLAGIDDAKQPNDMSTLRMAFSRLLAPGSVNYGEQVRLVDEQGGLVEASLLLQGRYLVLDPLYDLEPVKHTLHLSGLRSRGDEVLPDLERSFTPVDTGSQATSILKVGVLGEQQPDLASKLTGKDVNKVPVESFVLGSESFTRLEGDLAADLAYVPDFPGAVPLRVPAGSVLSGSPVEVNILGEVNAGIETGKVQITLLSDANGYLIPNPFSDAKDAPRYALLNMDAAMNAEESIANAALSQNLLNIQVAGLAEVKEGVLVMDAVAVVEPEILGLERASGTLSFRLEAYADQRNAPVPPTDTRPLALQSWSPGDDFQPNARPGDPIILNFTKPLDPASVVRDGAITVSVNGTPLPPNQVLMRQDGATIIIKGKDQRIVEHNQDVTITLTSLLRDTQGNPLNQDRTLEMRLPNLHRPNDDGSGLRSPVAAVFPGFSCALTEPVLTGERSTWRNGRCVGGQTSDPKFHVNGLYKDYPIRVLFNRTIDPATINEETFVVERRDSEGTWVDVPGRRDILAQRVEFYPDTPWRVGDLYRYTLRSIRTNPDCGVNAICTPDGAPLQTRQISQSSDTAPAPREGGPNMVNHFVAAGEKDRYTLVGLRVVPTVDANANNIVDGLEQGATLNPDGSVDAPANHLKLRLASTGGVISSANIGCEIGQTCPEKKYAFLSSGALAAGPRVFDPDVEVNRRLIDGDPDTDNKITGAIRANVYPTTISTTDVFLQARALGLITIGLETGPLVLRLVPQNPEEPYITGFISDTPDGPWFNATFDILVDAPELEPRLVIELGHDIRSKLVKNVTLEGPLRFVDDGRLVLKIKNPDPLLIPANINLIGIGLANVGLEVPALGADLTLTFLPVKNF
ncbi:Ig-like domain-containing protein [Marinobacter sp.]|uniref:Ig-like domain-containing protein n=1 Tax=Marinobacter sp. TaxID=50741 RepID=UPI0019B80CE1|nr:Ig-like domain-containing protein [Marinobacter sp.]MBC7190790.1 Ig-like domain-containing protein [Marinobacter sp.]